MEFKTAITGFDIQLYEDLKKRINDNSMHVEVSGDHFNLSIFQLDSSKAQFPMTNLGRFSDVSSLFNYVVGFETAKAIFTRSQNGK